MLVPRPYQIEGRDFLASRRYALLADEMRVGKTPQAILAAHKIDAKRVLTICPAIARTQWRMEWVRWSEACERDVPMCPVVSYNELVSNLPAYTSFKWDVVIADEAHYAKNPEAKRTQALYGKGGIGWQTRCMWSLSGTPAPNHAGELWPMLKAYGVVSVPYDEFVYHYCYYDPRQKRIWGNRPQKLEELRGLLWSVMMRRKRHEVAPEMPEIGFSTMDVDPVEGVDLTSTDIQQIDRENRIEVALAKAPQLVEEIENSLTGKLYDHTVVFGYHKEPLYAVRNLLLNKGITAEVIDGTMSPAKRDAILHRMHTGQIQALVLQMIAAGTAIDASIARHAYFLELDYVPANNTQAANRLVSMDKHDPVTIDVVNWPGTRDDIVQRTLLRKIKTAVVT